MGFRVRKRWMAGGVLAIALGLGFVLAGRGPVVAALAKSTDAFIPNGTDGRVLSEPGAEAEADRVADFLSEAVDRVETEHGRPFRNPFRVYVCATQQSLNEFIGLPPGAPIRGTVRFGDIFLAPSAFAWQGQDLHRESLLHEMSHLHLRQHLGFLAYRGKVPSWFHEGLADIVGEVGGEGITEAEALAAIQEGRALQPDSTGRLWTPERISSGGLAGPMFHRQSRMFLGYIRDRDPEAFQAFLGSLLDERELAGPFRRHLGLGTREMWSAFLDASVDPPLPQPT